MTVKLSDITPEADLTQADTPPAEELETPDQTMTPAEAVPSESPEEIQGADQEDMAEETPVSDVTGDLARVSEALETAEKRRAHTQTMFQKKSEELKLSESRNAAIQAALQKTLADTQAELKSKENELNARIVKLEEEGSQLSQSELVRESAKIQELAMEQAEARREEKSVMREVQRDCESSYRSYIKDNNISKTTSDKVNALLGEIEKSSVPHYAMTELAMLAMAGEELMASLPERDEKVKAEAVKKARELVRADTPAAGAQPAEAKPDNEDAPIINNRAMSPGEWSQWQGKMRSSGISSGFVPTEKRGG